MQTIYISLKMWYNFSEKIGGYMKIFGNLKDDIEIQNLLEKYEKIYGVYKKNKTRKKIIWLCIIAAVISMYIVTVSSKLTYTSESINPVLRAFSSIFGYEISVKKENNKDKPNKVIKENNKENSLESNTISLSYSKVSTFAYPLQHQAAVTITSRYGYYDPYGTGNYTMHTGIDLSRNSS